MIIRVEPKDFFMSTILLLFDRDTLTLKMKR